jgi:hypothetical protein
MQALLFFLDIIIEYYRYFIWIFNNECTNIFVHDNVKYNSNAKWVIVLILLVIYVRTMRLLLFCSDKI